MKRINRIWLVDDDKIYTYIMTKQIQILDCCENLEVFGNGQEAIDALRSHVADKNALPSLILLDLNMPVLDGWQFLDSFCEEKPADAITIYIVSSSIDPSDHERMHKYDCVSNFYVKPVKQSELQEMIEKATA